MTSEENSSISSLDKQDIVEGQTLTDLTTSNIIGEQDEGIVTRAQTEKNMGSTGERGKILKIAERTNTRKVNWN